jgi:CRP-like cAMP-binding protein
LAYLSLQSQLQGEMYIELPLSRTELAEYLFADRTALARELSNMKADSLIDFEKNTFRIL